MHYGKRGWSSMENIDSEWKSNARLAWHSSGRHKRTENRWSPRQRSQRDQAISRTCGWCRITGKNLPFAYFWRKIKWSLAKIRKGNFTPEVLQKTADILTTNPEYYTIWNHRRRIYTSEFASIIQKHSQDELTADKRDSQVLDIIHLDLQFLLPLLIQFPKCYWIWNHRLWLLEQATILLPADKARPLWEEELSLVGKMLNRENRNFLGWGYRRTVIDNLESRALNGRSMAVDELDYTTKMINSNLSNFSAWHNRTKLISRVLDEKSADDKERKQMLDEGEIIQMTQVSTCWSEQNSRSFIKHYLIRTISRYGFTIRTFCAHLILIQPLKPLRHIWANLSGSAMSQERSNSSRKCWMMW